jgi:hypothetical protein
MDPILGTLLGLRSTSLIVVGVLCCACGHTVWRPAELSELTKKKSSRPYKQSDSVFLIFLNNFYFYFFVSILFCETCVIYLFLCHTDA